MVPLPLYTPNINLENGVLNPLPLLGSIRFLCGPSQRQGHRNDKPRSDNTEIRCRLAFGRPDPHVSLRGKGSDNMHVRDSTVAGRNFMVRKQCAKII